MASTLRTLLVWLCAALTIGTAKAEAHEDVNAVDLIFEHVQDAYEWHITTVNGHPVAIPLPVIVRSSQRGTWHIFSSSRLAAGRTYEGFHIATTGDRAGKIVESTPDGTEQRPLDLSLTKNALALIINSLLMLAIFLTVARWYRHHPKHAVPGGFVGAVEMLVMSIEDDVIRKSIGPRYTRYSPYLLTAFFFILINNVMGLLPTFPGGANTTGNIAVTFVLAACTTIAVNVFGSRAYWKDIFWPDVPMWMKVPVPLMPIIELFGVISKPFALMIRLFANIMAGHSVAVALTCLIFITARMGVAMSAGMTFFSVLLSVFMGCLELLVAYIQAYVFTMLSAIFIGLSQPHE